MKCRKSRTFAETKRESGSTRRINEIRKRVKGNFTEEGLRAEAEKIDWNKITGKVRRLVHSKSKRQSKSKE